MAIQPIFHGVVKDGAIQFEPRERGLRHGWLKGLEGAAVDVIVRRHTRKRTAEQNRWHWGIAVPLIAHELGYDKHEHEAVHYALVSKCFGTMTISGQEVPKVRSSHLTTAQFSELMEWEVRWAATEFGIVVPLPGEIEAA